MELISVDPRQVEVVDRLRSIDRDYVELLAASIGANGLRAPIQVTHPGPDGTCRLIAGAHRLAALLQLGWESVPAIPFSGSQIEGKLAEIEENLIRRELSPLDQAAFMAEHKALWEALYPTTKHGGDRRKKHVAKAGDLKSAHPLAERFSKVVAKKLGLAERSVQRAVQRYHALTPYIRERIAGTWIANNGSALDDLVGRGKALTEAQQDAVLDLVLDTASGIRRIPDALVKLKLVPAPAAPQAGFQALVNAWEGNKGALGRARFVRWLLTEGGARELVLARNPRRFGFQIGDDGEPELRLLTRTNLLDGEAVPERKFVVHRFGGRYGDPWGLGLGNRLYWPVFFKRQGVGFWMGALEKFGQPTSVGKYPTSSSEDQQATLLAALGAIASDAGVAIPEGMTVELLEAKRAGSFDSYQTLARYMDDDIAKVVLGETLSTNAGDNGSRALGQVHNQVRLEIVKADADALSDTLNGSLVRWIVELNAPGYSGPMPEIWWEVQEAEDLNARAERDKKIHELGFDPLPDYIAQQYGEGWVKRQTTPPAGLNRLLPGASPGASFAQADDPRDTADRLAEQMDRVAATVQDASIDEVRALLERSADLAEFRDGLAGLFPALPTARFAQLMGEALVLAHMAGRSDLVDGLE